MSASALAGPSRPTLVIRGTRYPIVLPRPSDPRLHLAAVIVSLQVLGQVAFDFKVSIAQILVSLATCAILETAIVLRRQRVIMWPASALLTGNGVAFILRVPGTRHGDWWTLRGAWIFAATAAVSLLSKHLIRVGGRHLFNPSNFGLVICFLALGSHRADPLDFWWAPMSSWMAAALAIIVAGGLAILTRLRMLGIAVAFWLSFAGGIGVLAATNHAMTARWHLGPIAGGYFWWVLVSSPEILVFLFFMLTDPKTVPGGRRAQLAYAIAVGLLASILIASQRTEFATKVAVLGALAIVCALRPVVPRLRFSRPRAGRLVLVGTVALAAYTGVLVAAGIPGRLDRVVASPLKDVGKLPPITILPSRGVSSMLTLPTARRIAADLVVALRRQPGATRVTTYRLQRMRLWLRAGEGQGPPIAVADVSGTKQLAVYAGQPARLVTRIAPTAFRQRFELEWNGTRYLIHRSVVTASAPAGHAMAASFGGVRLTDVAHRVGLVFRQDAFRFGVTQDPPAMMGGGVCWLDYDKDGWLDLFVVNSYSEGDIGAWDRRGGLPESALFHNVHGHFVNVTGRAHAGLPLRGEGCVAADLNGDGYPDLFVTTAQDDVLLWNNGNGTFTEGARASGIVSYGWHSGAAVADVNGDGRPDLFVAGYTDMNGPIPGSQAGFPTNHQGVRDELFLNEGNGPDGHARFREVGVQAGLDRAPYDHSLGAIFSDVNGDGRPDLYVANDEDPNRLYLNESAAGPLGFRFVDRARQEGVADRNAGMGIGDFGAGRRADLFVTNSRGQGHAAFRATATGFSDARSLFAGAFGTNFTGWGVSAPDLNLDGRPDLVVANGGIPVTSLSRDARSVQVLENTGRRFLDASSVAGLRSLPMVNGRGVAAADFDNDGHVDLAVNSVGGRLQLLRSTGGEGHWLEVALPSFAPGAVVTAVLPNGTELTREVHAGSSYLSSEDPRINFGLGPATHLRELIVSYPNGRRTTLRGVRTDQILALKP